jgi:hypothetical protein
MSPSGPPRLGYGLGYEVPAARRRRPVRSLGAVADSYLSRRLGTGARRLAAAGAQGIGWRLVRVWAAPADEAARLQPERRLKHGDVRRRAARPRHERGDPAVARRGGLP